MVIGARVARARSAGRRRRARHCTRRPGPARGSRAVSRMSWIVGTAAAFIGGRGSRGGLERRHADAHGRAGVPVGHVLGEPAEALVRQTTVDDDGMLSRPCVEACEGDGWCRTSSPFWRRSAPARWCAIGEGGSGIGSSSAGEERERCSAGASERGRSRRRSGRRGARRSGAPWHRYRLNWRTMASGAPMAAEQSAPPDRRRDHDWPAHLPARGIGHPRPPDARHAAAPPAEGAPEPPWR